VGGDGGFDYVYADAAGRRLYIPRTGNPARVSVYNLDTQEMVGEIANTNARGAAVDPKSGHGFASSKPVAMWDTKTLAIIKTIDVQGGPDGILFDPFNQRVWVFSHGAPNATVINSVDGAVIGTVDLGGAPEQAATDGKGKLFVDLEDKDKIAVVDAAAMKVTGTYDLAGKGGGPGGLAFDAKNHVLFATCHEPAVMVMLNSDTGKILAVLPIGTGTDGATFNPATMEAFSSNGDGTLSVVKENSPTSFVVEQNLKTMTRAKTLTLDSKTDHILLIAAETAPPAAPPAGTPPPAADGRGGRGGRGQMVPGSFTILVVGK
jgi:DNA-binding beta-propeller fold protein YncE